MTPKARVAKLTAEMIMTPDVVAILPTMSLRQIIQTFLANEISGAPIVDQNFLVISVVSEADLMKFAALSSLDEPINKFLRKLTPTRKLIAVRRTDSFQEIFKQFLLNPVRRVIVTDAMGKLQGIISRRNLIRAFVDNEDLIE